MKLIAWNVNGLRAAIRHDFMTTFKNLNADIFCIGETKLQPGQIKVDLPGYHQYWNYADKKGYSGTAIFTKQEPLHVTNGLGVDELDHEGRTITLEYDNYYVIVSYTPNSQPKLKRLAFKRAYNRAFLNYINQLKANKPVIFCGDLNVAHQPIDLKNDATNHHNPGFSDEEREDFTELLNNGFIDTFRFLHPDEVKYSWWSYRSHAREHNAGWRIDYFVVSNDLKDQIKSADILTDIYGSDHCPVVLELK
ncbi:MAG: exodeoxyribonuclease III [Lentilactobacillus diolivorans]|jgi:exodeoxyribonuclease-3|nr:exodeoxyribonuclease III [Lentilactobacillus diolivorans]RRG01841.1 MAG: exodeoxyribonuclease III [Lactobacillus sp.]